MVLMLIITWFLFESGVGSLVMHVGPGIGVSSSLFDALMRLIVYYYFELFNLFLYEF